LDRRLCRKYNKIKHLGAFPKLRTRGSWGAWRPTAGPRCISRRDRRSGSVDASCKRAPVRMRNCTNATAVRSASCCAALKALLREHRHTDPILSFGTRSVRARFGCQDRFRTSTGFSTIRGTSFVRWRSRAKFSSLLGALARSIAAFVSFGITHTASVPVRPFHQRCVFRWYAAASSLRGDGADYGAPRSGSQ